MPPGRKKNKKKYFRVDKEIFKNTIFLDHINISHLFETIELHKKEIVSFCFMIFFSFLCFYFNILFLLLFIYFCIFLFYIFILVNEISLFNMGLVIALGAS